MRTARVVNAALALLTELALLGAAVTIPLASGAPLGVRIAGAVLLPAVVIAVWAVWAAPRAPRRLAARGRLLLEAALFALAAGGLATVGLPIAAVAVAAPAAVRLVLGAAIGEV